MSDNTVTVDYLVPLTVNVDLDTGKVVSVRLHLDSFQSSPSGYFLGEDGEHKVAFRAVFGLEEAEYVIDGESELGDKAFALADRVTIAEPTEIELRFTVDEEEGERSCGCPADYHLADCPILTDR